MRYSESRRRLFIRSLETIASVPLIPPLIQGFSGNVSAIETIANRLGNIPTNTGTEVAKVSETSGSNYNFHQIAEGLVSNNFAISGDGNMVVYGIYRGLEQLGTQMLICDIKNVVKEIFSYKTFADVPPSLSYDGNIVAFVRHMRSLPFDYYSEIGIYSLDNKDFIATVMPKGSKKNSSPQLSQSGGRVVFVSDDDKGQSHIYLYDIKTGMLRNISYSRTLDTHDAANYSPAISPDGTRVVFVRYINKSNDIYFWEEGIKIPTKLSNDGCSYAPSISDYGIVAWSTDKGGKSRIQLAELETSKFKRPIEIELDPDKSAISPMLANDGTTLVFEGYGGRGQKGRSVNAYVMDLYKRTFHLLKEGMRSIDHAFSGQVAVSSNGKRAILAPLNGLDINKDWIQKLQYVDLI